MLTACPGRSSPVRSPTVLMSSGMASEPTAIPAMRALSTAPNTPSHHLVGHQALHDREGVDVDERVPEPEDGHDEEHRAEVGPADDQEQRRLTRGARRRRSPLPAARGWRARGPRTRRPARRRRPWRRGAPTLDSSHAEQVEGDGHAEHERRARRPRSGRSRGPTSTVRSRLARISRNPAPAPASGFCEVRSSSAASSSASAAASSAPGADGTGTMATRTLDHRKVAALKPKTEGTSATASSTPATAGPTKKPDGLDRAGGDVGGGELAGVVGEAAAAAPSARAGTRCRAAARQDPEGVDGQRRTVGRDDDGGERHERRRAADRRSPSRRRRSWWSASTDVNGADGRHRQVADHAEHPDRGGAALPVGVHGHADGVGPVAHHRARQGQVERRSPGLRNTSARAALDSRSRSPSSLSTRSPPGSRARPCQIGGPRAVERRGRIKFALLKRPDGAAEMELGWSARRRPTGRCCRGA